MADQMETGPGRRAVLFFSLYAVLTFGWPFPYAVYGLWLEITNAAPRDSWSSPVHYWTALFAEIFPVTAQMALVNLWVPVIGALSTVMARNLGGAGRYPGRTLIAVVPFSLLSMMFWVAPATDLDLIDGNGEGLGWAAAFYLGFVIAPALGIFLLLLLASFFRRSRSDS